METDECVLCGIVACALPSSPVFEDEHVLAFMDLRPVTTGHLLVIPKVHVPFLAELDEELGAQVFRVGQRLAGALRRSGIPCEGVNMFLADGAVAFQEIFHVHLHVFPRTPGDGFGLVGEWRTRAREELDDAAALVRAALPPARAGDGVHDATAGA